MLMDDMHFVKLILIMLYIYNTTAKRKSKKYRDMSSESIENILYYKDCNHKMKTTEAPPVLLRAPQIQQCKMYCTMCCGDQCVDTQQMGLGRQNPVEPKWNALEPKITPVKPELQKRKKIKPIVSLPQRRTVSFTRENIKSLISKDEDIRKILKDLVRVTMQKVDLMQLVNERRRKMQENQVMSEESESENLS